MSSISKTNVKKTKLKPRVLCLSGLDPTGGAGIQADIETLQVHHCQCLPVITLNSVQDSQGVYQISATATKLISAQIEKLKLDGEIAAIKIGMLANAEQVNAVFEILKALVSETQHQIPIVLDPVFGSGLGKDLAQQNHITAIFNKLLPICTLVTPNTLEAEKLAQCATNQNNLLEFSNSAQAILSSGVQNVLITGTHEEKDEGTIFHHLSSSHHTKQQHLNLQHLKSFSVPRLSGVFHGSGCTLASAICANLANGHSIEQATESALEFTQSSLNNAQALGKHQLFPNRFPS